MRDQHEKVSRLRQIMREAVPVQTVPISTPEAEAWRAFQRYDYNTPPPPIDRTPRGKAIREINRIAAWYCWQEEVHRWLANTAADSLGELDDVQLQALRDHMKQLENCANDGLGSPFAPAAS